MTGDVYAAEFGHSVGNIVLMLGRSAVSNGVAAGYGGERPFIPLPKRWAVERSIGWAARFRRMGRDHERLAATLEALHWLAFVSVMLASLFRY